MTKKRLISLLTLFCFCILNLSAQTSTEFPIKSIAQLQDTINKIIAENHQSSLILAIATKDTVLYSHGFGVTNIETKQKVNSQTLFPMASITKTFTALAIMKLVKQEKLSLYDNLSKIAPEIAFTNSWEKSNPVKIIHLLEHTSGFDDLHFNTFWNDNLDITELQAVEKCKSSMYCRWEPGERMAYSNVGYAVLGYLIEKLSGSKYEDFLKKEILMPIGMTNSNFIIPVKPSPLNAVPYNWDGNKYIRLPYLQFYGKGAGALYSCADDMSKFISFMIRNGINDSLSELYKIVEQMEIPESTPAAQLGLKTGYAKGIQLDFLDFKYPFYGHGGTDIGFFSRYAYNRNLNAGFLVCGTDLGLIPDLVVKFLTESLPIPNPIPSIAVNIDTLKSYEGYYQLKSPRFEILGKYLEELLHGYHIEVRGDSLYSYGFKRPDQVLLPVTSTIFKKENQNSPSFLFTKNKKNIKVLYEWGAYYEKTSYTQILIIRIFVLGGLACGILLILSSLFWIIRAIYKRITWKEYFKRSLSAFGVLSLTIAFGTLAYLVPNVPFMGTINFFTMTFFIGTLLFAFFCITGFAVTIKRFSHIPNKLTKWYLLVTSTWLLPLVYFFYHYGWIGLRMWSY